MSAAPASTPAAADVQETQQQAITNLSAAAEISEAITALEGRLRDKAKEDKLMLFQLRNALKKHEKEIKTASKKRRSHAQTAEDGSKPAKQRKAADPVVAKKALAEFLGVPEGSSVDVNDVRTKISAYIADKKLKDSSNGKLFIPDEALGKVLGAARYPYSGDKLGFSFLNMSRYITDAVEKVAPAGSSE